MVPCLILFGGIMSKEQKKVTEGQVTLAGGGVSKVYHINSVPNHKAFVIFPFGAITDQSLLQSITAQFPSIAVQKPFLSSIGASVHLVVKEADFLPLYIVLLQQNSDHSLVTAIEKHAVQQLFHGNEETFKAAVGATQEKMQKEQESVKFTG